MRTKSPSKPKKIDLTISIVSYNTKELLQRCLQSIFSKTKGITFEVIVVDNASTDGSLNLIKNQFPSVKLIANRSNRFYTGANNQSMAIAKGKYFLILNSDIYLKANTFKSMVNYLKKHPEVGAVEPLQLYEDGRIAPTGSKHNSPYLDFIELTWFGRTLKPFFYKQLNRFRLIGKNRQKDFSAEVICDAVMMLPTALFKKLGGYDERFKLYYTENDLCKQIQAQKLSTVHLGKIKVFHTVSASTDKAGWKMISSIYAADALTYFRKYHSSASAYILYLAMHLNNVLILLKKNLGLIVILLLATWLRFYRLPELMTFLPDMGRDYLAARDMVLTGNWPMVGIPSSVPWLHQGAFFIWLTALALKLGNFNPLAPAILTATLGALAVYFVYQLMAKLYDQKVGLLSALVMAVSPLAVTHARLAYHVSPIPLLTAIFLLTAYRHALKEIPLYWPVFWWGMLLQFELTAIPAGLFLAIPYLTKKLRLNKKALMLAITALAIPFMPKIIYDISHGFTQTAGLVAWGGYRLVTPRLTNFLVVSQTIGHFLGRFSYWAFFILVIPVLKQAKFLSLFLLINFIGFYIHGGPSEAYFPLLFPVFAGLLGLALSQDKSRLGGLLIGLFVAINIMSLIKNNFFPYGPTLSQRYQLAHFLAQKEPAGDFKLLNYSDVAHFSTHLDNYRYLLWLSGVSENLNSTQSYTIYDGLDYDFLPPLSATIYHFPGQKLIKHD